MSIRKDRRFWLYDDRVNGRIGAFYEYFDVPTDDEVEGRGLKFRFIPIRDVNNNTQVFTDRILNMIGEAPGLEPGVEEAEYVTVEDNIEIVTPDNSHKPGVPEKRIIVYADQHGHSRYNRESGLQEKVHELEQEKKRLQNKLDASDLTKRELEQEAGRDEGSKRKGRNNRELAGDGFDNYGREDWEQ